MVGTRNLVLGQYFNVLDKNRVQIPAYISTQLFMLDIERTVQDAIEDRQKMTDEKFASAVSLIVKSYDALSQQDMASQLMQLGFKVEPRNDSDRAMTDEERVGRFVDDIKARVARSLSQSGLSNVTVNTFLNASGDKKSYGMKEFSDCGLADVAGVVAAVQSVWMSFKGENAPGAELAEVMETKVTSSKILTGLRHLNRALRSASGSYVSCKESFFMNHMLGQVYGDLSLNSPLDGKRKKSRARTPQAAPIIQGMVAAEPIIPGLFYQITGVASKDLSFADALAAYMWCFNLSSGTDTDFEQIAEVKIESLISELVSGIGIVTPFVPSEAGKPDVERLEQHFMQVFFINLFHRAATNQIGEFYARVNSAINQNKFFELDEHRSRFDEALRDISMSYEAFRDTAFYFRDTYRREDIMFSDFSTLHPAKRRKIVDFVEDLIAEVAGVSLSMEHPAYYKQPYHVTTHVASFLNTDPIIPEWTLSRRERDKMQRYIMASDMAARLQIGTSGLTDGSTWFDILDALKPLNLTYELIAAADPIKPLYYIEVPHQHTMLEAAAIRAYLAFVPLDKLKAYRTLNPVIYDAMMACGQIVTIDSPEDLSAQAAIPLDMAEKIYASNTSNEYLDVTEMNSAIYFVSDNVVQVREVIERNNESVSRYVPPFVAKYPALVTRMTSAMSFKQFLQDPINPEELGRPPIVTGGNNKTKTGGENESDPNGGIPPAGGGDETETEPGE